jgi:hypothetical protein
MRFIAPLSVLLVLLPSLCLADLVPHNWKELERRAKDGDYEVADQFCAGKVIGTRCEIPGTPLDGGGQGACALTRPDRSTLAATCQLDEPAKIDRQLDGGWRLSQPWCERLSPEDIRSLGYPCHDEPVVVDQFCRGKAEGDPCVAEVWQKNSWSSHPGRCVKNEQIAPARPTRPGQLGPSITREITFCLGEHPVVRTYAPSSPPSFLQRIFQ